MDRVALEHLEHRADDRAYWNGSPFTGIAYAAGGGRLTCEIGDRDGRRWGPSRSWYGDGRPASEEHYAWDWAHGVFRQLGTRPGGRTTRGDAWDWAHGVFRQWHGSGPLAVEETYEWGVLLERRAWDEQGRLIAAETLSDTGPEFELLAQRRSKFGRLAYVTDTATPPPARLANLE